MPISTAASSDIETSMLDIEPMSAEISLCPGVPETSPRREPDRA
jgi:hypothetical protein